MYRIYIIIRSYCRIKISNKVRNQLLEELDVIKKSLGGIEDLEDYIKQVDDSVEIEKAEAARRKNWEEIQQEALDIEPEKMQARKLRDKLLRENQK